jgi:hypothetical protein
MDSPNSTICIILTFKMAHGTFEFVALCYPLTKRPKDHQPKTTFLSSTMINTRPAAAQLAPATPLYPPPRQRKGGQKTPRNGPGNIQPWERRKAIDINKGGKISQQPSQRGRVVIHPPTLRVEAAAEALSSQAEAIADTLTTTSDF